jgi:MerR family transcriptional regulator, light-induced transcriptional regulator
VHGAPNGDLSTAQLARRTGLPAGTLRIWESRHGFPSAQRLRGGHRRYGERDVESVLEVLRMRTQGLSLPAAIALVRKSASPPPSSIFAGMRHRHPEVQPVVLTKPALLALTRAIEDEYLASAASGLLIGSFQRVAFYRSSERRWRELARTAKVAVAFADFKAVRQPEHGPAEVPVPRKHALNREWAVVIDAPAARACLAALEHTSAVERPDAERRFEVLWSFEPGVVQAATRVAIELVDAFAPELARDLFSGRGEPPATDPPELRFAAALAHRVVSYLVSDQGDHRRS